MSHVALNANAIALGFGIEEARRFVYRDEDDSSRDGQLIDAINFAANIVSAEVPAITAASGATRRLELDRSGFVDLRPWELRTLTSVVLHPDRPAAEQLTLTTDQWRLFPVGGTSDGTYLWMTTIAPVLYELEPGFGWQVSVTGDWGIASAAPKEAIKLPFLTWVKNIVENPGDYASVSMSGYTVIPNPEEPGGVGIGGGGLPAALRKRLKRFDRELLLV